MKTPPLFAWVTLLEDGNWSLVGVMTTPGMYLCLVSHNEAVVRGFRPFAERHGKGLNQPVYLVRFDAMHVLESINPPG